MRVLRIDRTHPSWTASGPYTPGPSLPGEVAMTRDGLEMAAGTSQGITVSDDLFHPFSSLPDPTVAGVQFRP